LLATTLAVVSGRCGGPMHEMESKTLFGLCD